MAKKVKELVEELVTPIVEKHGCELVEVEYAKKVDGMNLTIYIDAENGIQLEHCEKIHNEIDPLLDELDPTDNEPYILNVSSPGLDRPIKTDRDFRRNIGKEIEIKLYAPINKKKVFVGELKSFNDDIVEIIENGTDVEIDRQKIANIVPVLKF